MRRIDITKKPHIVEEFYIGECKISIADDSCVKTQEEIDAILEKVSEIVYDALLAQHIREISE